VGDLAAGFLYEINEGDGYIQVSMSHSVALTDAAGGVLIELTFAVTENAPVGLSLPVRLSDVELNGPYGDSLAWYVPVESVNGTLEVEDQSVLNVTPTARQLGSGEATVTFEVTNGGGGTMHWVAQVTQGADSFTITAGAGGTNDGTIEVTCAANTSFESRTGTIQVTAATANGSPVTVTVLQSAMASYTLTMAVEGQGLVQPSVGAHTFRVGEQVSLVAASSPGWEFDHWEGNVGNASAATTTITMYADETVTAVFLEGPSEGEGEGQGPGCFGGRVVPPTSTEMDGRSGDVFFLLLVASVLTLINRRKRRKDPSLTTRLRQLLAMN